MSININKIDGSETIQIDVDALSIGGYVTYLLDEGYDVPPEFRPAASSPSSGASDSGTARPGEIDRSVERTPGGQPIYGSVVTAKSAMDALYAEKMAQVKKEQPALFPKPENEMEAGPAEEARSKKWVPPHRRAAYAENTWSDSKVKKGQAIVSKKINLSAVLRDRSVQTTYSLNDKQLNLVQVMMQVSPEKAAIKATESIRDNGHKVVVIADMTAASRSVARASLERAASDVGPHIRNREVPMVYLPGSTLVSLTPPPDSDGEDEHFTWELTGPGREFVSVAAVWILVMQHGPFEVADRFGSDYGFLRIMLTVIEKTTRRATTLNPGYEFHSGVRSDAWSDMSRDLSNALVELADVDIGCVAVTEKPAIAVASALIVDERWAAVPYHVLKTPGGKVDGELMEKADVKRLGNSVYAVQLKSDRVCVPPIIRAPSSGETVRLRVVGFNAAERTKTLVTGVGEIVANDRSWFVNGFEAYPGASGAHYVAEKDGSVVGLHDGSGPLGAKMLPFSVDTQSLLHAALSWFGGGGPTLTRVLSPTVRYWSRNKASRAAWASLSARFGLDGGALTVIDGDVRRAALTLDQVSADPSWSRAGRGDSFLTHVYHGRQAVDHGGEALLVRAGSDGEPVVVVCYDHEGLYMSSEVAFGQEGSVGKTNHSWTSMLRNGALVVAVKDVAVVGVMARVACTSDWVTFRATVSSVSMDKEQSSVGGEAFFGPDAEANRRWLKEKFPFLTTDSYSSEAIDECFTHVSCGKYTTAKTVFSGYQNMARIGDAIMRVRYHVHLRLIGVDPQATTVLVNKWQNNDVQSVVATQFGLPDQLRRASRLTTVGQHGFADALEALACLVYFSEDEVVLDKFLRVIAMFGES